MRRPSATPTSDPREPPDPPHDDALVLPAAWAAPPRPPIPIVAATVPVIGAVALWLVTGSILSLWLAALGPLVALATAGDAARTARRDRRRHRIEADAQRVALAERVTRRHEIERRHRRLQHPDVASYLDRDGEVWRSRTERGELLVLGSGDVESGVRMSGGEGDPASLALRARAARLTDAPLVVPARAGVVVSGAPVLARGVQRALAMQLCLALPPGELRIVGALDADLAWAEHLPHRRATSGVRLMLLAPGERADGTADIVLARRGAGEPAPLGCAVTVDVEAPTRARVDHAGAVGALAIEALSAAQARAVGEALTERARISLRDVLAGAGPVSLAELASDTPQPAPGTLPAAIGRDAQGTVTIDLVRDGPHAVVTGVTGAGKSELLITWVLALASAHTTAQVSFLLADFKGGTAFDALAEVPHVTGVITDLDGDGARRAFESLRAEVRWREGALAESGARDIADVRVQLPRLVVVIDEFAAVLAEHPELNALFSDLAARGRALGIHLILGTQRASGVIRDSLLANCPLRMSLRVTDAADSRLLLGTSDAAELPGDRAAAGLALIRRAADAEPQRVRIALSHPDDATAIVARGETRPRRPWLPDLPNELRARDLPDADDPGSLVLGLADEPDRQHQGPASVSVADGSLLVVGGPRAGKSTALHLVADQARNGASEPPVVVPADTEAAWDLFATWRWAPPPRGTVIVLDDLDGLVGRFPGDHARIFVEAVEDVVRAARERGILIVASMQRVAGAAARTAELFHRRLLLSLPSRADHVAAGGDPAHHVARAPAGRGRLDDVRVQIALPRTVPGPVGFGTAAAWFPEAPFTGLVARRTPAVRAALECWEREGAIIVGVEDAAPVLASGERLVAIGEPDEWQRKWPLLTRARVEHDLVIDASCAAEVRLLTGFREPPPFCRTGAPRGWLMRSGADPVRIVLPAADSRADRVARDA